LYNIHLKGFQQAQNLNVFPLAGLAHSGLKQTVQV
jgi:hypothetical protein